MTDTTQSTSVKRGFVKQVLSGDSIVLQGPATNGPPKEITVYLSNVSAPRLAKRPMNNNDGMSDEPYAWEAREYLRKKIVGKIVVFVRDFIATSGREHGRIYLGGTNPSDSENVSESAVAEGWLEARPAKQPDEFTQKLTELQEQAKLQKKGRWSDDDSSLHIRNVQWTFDDPRVLLEKYKGKEIDAIVEQVRDGSTFRVCLLPNYEIVSIMLSGVKAPGVRLGTEGKNEEYREQAKYFVESRLLQRNVKVILEGVSNQNFIGSIIHPRGNIAEFLLKEGYGKIVEWSLGLATSGPLPLREAEKYAKEHRLRLWKNYIAGPSIDRNSFNAKVIEIGLGDTVTVLKNDSTEMKIFFSSIKPPRRDNTNVENGVNVRQFRPLYDIPFMFEAREFLRKRLIGKNVNVTIDYIQPKTDQFPEKHFATILHNNNNITEMLVAKGLAKVVRHRQDDESRSTRYDDLLAAEAQAEKEKKGMWADKTDATNTLRVVELQGDVQRSKQFLPYLQRTAKLDGIVEFIASGSRLRIYVPKEACIITFLLGGISCPRSARIGPGGKLVGENELYAEEAYFFTKTKCLQHDVQFEVESMDKAGGFIGYLFVKNETGSYVNISEQLVENGLAKVHFTAERSNYYNALMLAEKKAKENKLNLWKNFVENDVDAEKQNQSNDVTERKINFKKVAVTEVFSGLRFAAQAFEDRLSIERLMNNLQIELKQNTPLTTVKRGQLVAACFHDLWHRVRVEAIKNDKADIYYIDFGNRESVHVSKLSALPTHLQSQAPCAKEYYLAFVGEPNDPDYAQDSKEAFERLVYSYPHLLLNFEYKLGTVDAVTLYAEENDKKVDIGKTLVESGNALVEQRRETRFKTLVADYLQAENNARRCRLNIWKYGDFTGSEI